jgi:hypothetical protein
MELSTTNVEWTVALRSQDWCTVARQQVSMTCSICSQIRGRELIKSPTVCVRIVGSRLL